MAYFGKTQCPGCKRAFDYFCLPYRNNDDDTEEPLRNRHVLNKPHMAQMCLEWVDENNIPKYTAYCPHCDRIAPMLIEDAREIPAFYFEKYSEQTD